MLETSVTGTEPLSRRIFLGLEISDFDVHFA